MVVGVNPGGGGMSITDIGGGIEDTWNDATPDVGSPDDWVDAGQQTASDGLGWMAGTTDTLGQTVGDAADGVSETVGSDGPWLPGLDNAIGGAADNVENAADWGLGGGADAIGNAGNWAGRGLGGSVRGIGQTIGSTLGGTFGALGRNSGVGDAAQGMGDTMFRFMKYGLIAVAILGALGVAVMVL